MTSEKNPTSNSHIHRYWGWDFTDLFGGHKTTLGRLKCPQSTVLHVLHGDAFTEHTFACLFYPDPGWIQAIWLE